MPPQWHASIRCHWCFCLLAVLEDGLKTNFRDVSVGVVDCPDLTQQPWGLAAPGILVGGVTVQGFVRKR